MAAFMSVTCCADVSSSAGTVFPAFLTRPSSDTNQARRATGNIVPPAAALTAAQ